MRLTQLTDVGLRVLMYLTVFEDQICTVDEMVRNCLARKQLTLKAIQRLKTAGYIKSRRGRTGGFELARQPETISTAEIILLLEPDMALTECIRLGDKAKCAIVGNCILETELRTALGKMILHLDSIKISDLTINSHDIIKLNKKYRTNQANNWIY